MKPVDWTAAVELASRAPSVHNTQPWRFVTSGDGVELRADRTRALPALDPTGRQLVLSCGAALEHLRLALLAQGRSVEIEAFPSPADPDLLARMALAGDATPDPVDTELIRAIPIRTTVRAPFDPRPIPADTVDDLRDDAVVADAWVMPVTRPDDTIALMVLLEHADAAEQADPAYEQEVRQWRREGSAPDGIPDAAVPATEQRHISYIQREFGAHANTGQTAGESPAVDEKPLIVIVGTTNDRELDWLNAGRRLARLQLRAASLGIVSSPLNQVIDDPTPRQQLRAQLGMLGWPQMVLRMGYGTAAPATGRRPAEEVLRTDPT